MLCQAAQTNRLKVGLYAGHQRRGTGTRFTHLTVEIVGLKEEREIIKIVCWSLHNLIDDALCCALFSFTYLSSKKVALERDTS